MNCPSNSEGITVPKENPPKAERSRVRDPPNRLESGREADPAIVVLRRCEPPGPFGSRSGIRSRSASGGVNLLPSGCCHKPDEADDEADDEDDISEIDPKSTLSK